MSVVSRAPNSYEFNNEQSFREWTRRGIDDATRLANQAIANLALIVDFVGDSGAGGEAGLVPAPAIGDAAKFLKGDGTWATISASVAWGGITGTLSAQTDLQTALNGKSDTGHTHPWTDITGEPTTLAGYGIVDAAALVHTHAQADVTNLVTDLAGKAASVHTHAWSDITGEPTTLSGYGITDGQPLDADLTALAALTSTAGMLARTGADTFAVRTITGTASQIAVANGDGASANPTLSLEANARTVLIEFVIDGGGVAITTGIKGDLYTNFTGIITGVVLLADQTGSIVVDIWEDTYTNFPPTVADSMTASAKPTIAATNKAKDTTLTGWTTAIAADSVLRFNVDSCATITRCTVALTVLKT